MKISYNLLLINCKRKNLINLLIKNKMKRIENKLKIFTFIFIMVR